MIPSLEGWPTKTKEAPSPHEVRLALLDTNPVFQSLGGIDSKAVPLDIDVSFKYTQQSHKFGISNSQFFHYDL